MKQAQRDSRTILSPKTLCFLLAICGCSTSSPSGNGGSGGTVALGDGTGGVSGTADGGVLATGTGGVTPTGSGGATSIDAGDVPVTGTGGATPTGSGGATSTGSGGVLSTGGSGGSTQILPSGTTVTFANGQAQGAMTGKGWVAMGSLDTTTEPTCAGGIIGDSKSCTTATIWNATDRLCTSGHIPVVTADTGGYDANWGIEIGVDATNATPPGTLGRSFTAVTFTLSGSIAPSSAIIRGVVHRVQDPPSTGYCAPVSSGVAIPMSQFNTACWDHSGTGLTSQDVSSIDKVGVQIVSDVTSAYTVANFCLTGISFSPEASAGSAVVDACTKLCNAEAAVNCSQAIPFPLDDCIAGCERDVATDPPACVDLDVAFKNCFSSGPLRCLGTTTASNASCTVPANALQNCLNGTSQPVCSGALTLCPSGCVDLSINVQNCGYCGHMCAPSTFCRGGSCI
jgi:hypothetical protein